MSKVLFTIVVVLLFFLLYFINNNNSYEVVNKLFKTIPVDRFLISKDYNNFKDGDIYYNANHSNLITKNAIPSPFNHIGIIIKKDNKLYILESSRIGFNRDDNGVHLHKYGEVHMECLLDKIEYSLNLSFICKLNKHLDDERREKLHYLSNEYLGKKYPSSTKLFFQYLFNYPKYDTVCCYELISDILSNLDLIHIPNGLKNSIKVVANIHKYELKDSYYYEEPKQIIYDNI